MPRLTYASIDQTILDTLTPPQKYYWLTVFLLFVGVMIGAACWNLSDFYRHRRGRSKQPGGLGNLSD